MPAYVTANNVASSSAIQNAFSSSTASIPGSATGPKVEDVAMRDATIPDAPPQEPKASLYRRFESATEITYQPENALKEGLGMVKALKGKVKTLELGSKLRKEVWLREVERSVASCPADFRQINRNCSLQAQGAPTTVIAICGGRSHCSMLLGMVLITSHYFSDRSREIVPSQCHS